MTGFSTHIGLSSGKRERWSAVSGRRKNARESLRQPPSKPDEIRYTTDDHDIFSRIDSPNVLCLDRCDTDIQLDWSVL